MAAMTNLYRHPKTGMYWVRRKVPTDLRSVLDKGEIQKTTRTKNLAEAKVRAKPIGIEIDRIFADVRAGTQRSNQGGPNCGWKLRLHAVHPIAA